MSPFDVLAEGMGTSTINWAFRELAEHDYVTVKCGVGDHISVKREAKPCETCNGDGDTSAQLDFPTMCCRVCGGSGVVEATTIHGLERVLGLEACMEVPMTVFRAVALPEETPANPPSSSVDT